MKNSIDGSIDKLTLSRTMLLQCFYQLMLTRPFIPDYIERYKFCSKRLLMKPLQYQDKKFYTKLFTNKKVTKYTGGAFTKQQAEKNFVNTLKELSVSPIQYLTWLVETKNKSESVGIITLISHDQQKQLTEFGVMLSANNYNQGYCSELTETFISYCFKTLKLPSLYTFTVHKNMVAQHIMKKFNFVGVAKVPFEQLEIKGSYWHKINSQNDTKI
jgi:RimJ/RimL family protein N-acetyltransferase